MGRVPTTLARSFTVNVSITRRKEVGRWWATLAAGEKRGLRKVLADDLGRLPIVTVPLVARFADPPAKAEDVETGDLYDWIVGHELEFFHPRTIHICSAHPAARAAVDDRVLHADFACPLGNVACPMRTLLDLAPGHDAVFSADLVRVRRCR
jgi:hypothetical protein